MKVYLVGQHHPTSLQEVVRGLYRNHETACSVGHLLDPHFVDCAGNYLPRLFTVAPSDDDPGTSGAGSSRTGDFIRSVFCTPVVITQAVYNTVTFYLLREMDTVHRSYYLYEREESALEHRIQSPFSCEFIELTLMIQ